MKVISRLILSISLVLVLLSAGYAPAQKPSDPQRIDPKPTALDKDPLLAELLKAEPKDNELRKLQKARYWEAAELLRQLEPRLGNISGGDYTAQVTEVHLTQQRLLHSGLDLADKPEVRIALFAKFVEQAKAFEANAKIRADSGSGPALNLNRARYYRLDAEIQLLKAKQEFEKTKGK